jgi:hypothetical protein
MAFNQKGTQEAVVVLSSAWKIIKERVVDNVELVGKVTERIEAAVGQALPHVVDAYWWGTIGKDRKSVV